MKIYQVDSFTSVKFKGNPAGVCLLAPFWNMKLGKTNFKSKQLSKRTGELKTAFKGDRVEIFGQAKTVFIIEMIE